MFTFSCFGNTWYIPKSLRIMIGDRYPKSPTRRLTILYSSSLALVACLSIAGQVVIQRLLSQQQLDIQVVGNVERQQLLSQRLAKFS
ncbi:hypothetical protein [Rivularia sp. UHCC 0363]|uniref:hypothetical protein n=1 Tax=Rivularia sp. UHCC 0363 TaxID=3110244 RepID=UPI002B20019D|nr:hypothetical protein [Rivularia sp. UHCC 0363]MEA5598074.1 hypothetical protein [Rivularia sp. UHCC 0363]